MCWGLGPGGAFVDCLLEILSRETRRVLTLDASPKALASLGQKIQDGKTAHYLARHIYIVHSTMPNMRKPSMVIRIHSYSSRVFY